MRLFLDAQTADQQWHAIVFSAVAVELPVRPSLISRGERPGRGLYIRVGPLQHRIRLYPQNGNESACTTGLDKKMIDVLQRE